MARTIDPRRTLITLLMVVGCALAGFAGGWVAAETNMRGDAVREYLLANPETIPEAIAVLQEREQSGRLAPIRASVEAPYPGAVLGNPDGGTVLVEFSDYACGYCRASVPDVEAAIAANPDLKVVIREFPILSEASRAAAQMALAAADQGRFAAFHRAMFAAGRPDDATIAAAATRAGIDLEAARAAIAAGRYDAEIDKNAQLADRIGISGTPAFLVGDQVLAGAAGEDALLKAIDAASS